MYDSDPMKSLLIILSTLSIVTSCAIVNVSESWPDNIPSRSYFVSYYGKDKEHQEVLNQNDYLRWVHRFYFGWELYRRGWLQATDELVQTLDDPQEKLIAQKKVHYHRKFSCARMGQK
jgi:hypothetical protein